MLLDSRAMAGSIGGAPVTATYILQTPNGFLGSAQALSALATGLLKNTTATGVLSIAAQGVDYYAPGGTDVAIADGGTGASTAADARINLGITIPPFTDTNALIQGSADPTKLLRFEVDGFTAGVTRAMTPPDADITLAGQNYANTFSLDQTFNEDIFQAIGKSIGIGTVTPLSFFHFLNNSVATNEFRMAGPPNSIHRFGLWESTADNPNNGGYFEYDGSGDTFKFGGRTGSTTDVPVLQINVSSRAIAIGVNSVLGGVSSVAIGRKVTTAHQDAIVIGTGNGGTLTSPATSTISFGLGAIRRMVITTTGVGFGTDTPGAKIHADQASATGAIPTLRLRQADLSEEFIRLDATVGAGNPIDTAALGAYYGKFRVYVEGVGSKWVALYD